jgi:predicted nucleic acid-binding protein
VDYSRVSFCRVSDESDDFELMRSKSIRHTRDALIASTARFERCTLVTNEHRLAKRSRERGIDVVTSAELLAEFGFAVPLPRPPSATVPSATT